MPKGAIDLGPSNQTVEVEEPQKKAEFVAGTVLVMRNSSNVEQGSTKVTRPGAGVVVPDKGSLGILFGSLN